MEKKRIVIIGGGFGGIYTARYLKSLIESGKIDVTIINRSNFFLFTPLLHEVATGGLSPTSVVEPIREIFRHSNVQLVQDEVRSIDPSAQKVSTITTSIPYDYLVVSSGAETNYCGTLGAKENTLALKDLNDAQLLRKTLIDACEKGALVEDEEERRKILSCIIVGAGATGVELAAEVVEFMHETLCAYYHSCKFDKAHMKVTLVATSPDVLPQFPPPLREIAKKELIRKGIHVMTNETVVEVRKGKIIFADKSFLHADTIVWVAGVKPSIIEIPGMEYEKSGRFKIDGFLNVIGHKNIFALGDVSGNAPMLAQVASQQGKVVAQNIMASIAGTPLRPFKFHEKGLLVSLGQWYAVGKIYGVVMKGPFMWFIWRSVYLFNFHSWRKRIKIGVEWTVNIFYPRDITEY